MKVVNFSDARNNFKKVIDEVVENADYTIISRRNSEDAIVMSLNTFNSIMETFHLLKSPANTEHLSKSIKQYKQGKARGRELINE